MKNSNGSDLVYRGPWFRTAQNQLFQTLETDYGFPRATCRSLVNLMWDFVNDHFGEKLHDGQVAMNVIAIGEPPGKKLEEMRTVSVHLTVHEPEDLEFLSKEGIATLRRKKIIRMTNEARDQGGLLTQEDLAVLLCSSARTIKRDIRALRQQGIEVPTRGTITDIGPGVSHKARIVELWLQGYEYTDIERKTGHCGTSVQRYLSGFSKAVRFHNRKYSMQEIRSLTDLSERLVKEYLNLYKVYKRRPESKERIEQVLSENLPFKKRAAHRKKRGGGMVR